MASFWSQIKRRKVFRVAAVYAVVAWLIVQVVGAVNEPLNLPERLDTVVIVLLTVGFPIAIILAWAFDLTPEGIKAASDVPTPTPAQSAPQRFSYVSQTLVLLAVGYLVFDQFLFDAPETSAGRPSGVSRLVMPQPDIHPFSLNGYNYDLAISPDGSRIAYRALEDGQPVLVVRPLDSFETTRLHTGNVVNLFFSPGGDWIGFVDIDTQNLYRVSITGGPAIEIASLGRFPRGAVWSANDQIIYATGTPAGLFRVPVGGGTPELLTALDETRGEIDHLWPHLVPGENALTYTVYTNRQPNEPEIRLLDLESGEQRPLLRAGSDGQVLPTGHLVYRYQTTLRALPFDLDRREVTGNAVAVIDDMSPTNVDSITGAIAANGTLVYVRGNGASNEIVFVSSDRQEERVGMELGDLPAMSADARRYAWARGNANSESDIWVWSVGSGAPQQLTFEAGDQRRPLFTPDGERIVYVWYGEGLFSRAANGSGTAQRLFSTSELIQPVAWSPEGELIFQTRENLSSDFDIGVLSPGTAPDWTSRLILDSDVHEMEPAISPDGRWLAYTSTETGRAEVYVRSYQNLSAGGKWRVSQGGGSEPHWSSDGGRLFFLELNSIMEVDVSGSSALSFGTPVALLNRGNYRMTNTTGNYDVTPDDRFVLIKRTGDRGSSEIVVVQNWFEELEALVPSE